MTRRMADQLPWIAAVVIILLDQWTKWIVDTTMRLGQSISVIGDLLRWTYIHNDGLAFGVEVPGGRLLGLVSLGATLVFIIILLRMRRSEPLHVQVVLGLIIGGAIGNTIDRLRQGYVIDFIDVDMPNWLMQRWHVFNIADSAVSVGVVLLLLFMLLDAFGIRAAANSDALDHEPGDPSPPERDESYEAPDVAVKEEENRN
ncbi:signal peptidase II [bacterium]|nr:signal peptidase II [bacterium]